VRRFPGEPQVWIRLAEYQLDTLAKPADALKTIRGALYLDPKSRAAQQVFLEARKRLNPVVPTPAITPTPTTPGTAPGKTPAAPGGVRPTPGGGAPGPTPGRPIAPLSPGDPRG
jgi:hypothetical protein